MKHKLFWILAIILVSCKEPVIIIQTEEIPIVVSEITTVEPVPETFSVIVVETPVKESSPEAPAILVDLLPNVRIYNSEWEIIREGYAEQSRSIAINQSYDDYVIEYNASHTDDQLFIVKGEKIIPIEESLPVDAYIVDPKTHNIIKEYKNWPRIDLVDRREVWRFQATADGGVLYVDQVPPPPVIVVDDRPAYEKYALYLIYTATGIIKYEEHPETEAEYLDRRAMYLIQEAADGGLTYVVSGRLYQ